MTSAPAVVDDVDLARRFSGLERLFGVEGAQRIRAAHVAIVGVGGVGQLTLIDLDHVAESNINRQVHAVHGTIGQAKVQAMRDRVALINPQCQVRCVEEFVEPENWPAVLGSATVDAVIDACDKVRAKTAMAAWAQGVDTLFITVGAAGGKRQAQLVEIDDLARATHDPLLAQLRNQLRRDHGAPREGRKIGVTCVFSREPVAPADASCAIEEPDGSLNCHGYGSLVTVTAGFGQCAAGWVINAIAAGSPQ